MRVNISALQLQRSDLVGDVAHALERTQVPAAMLCLEITETAVMTDVEQSMDVLAQLHTLGVQLAIDDFGTGFSSLAYLKRFPVEILKIDKSFVDDVASDPDVRAIVASVLGLASSLDLEVIAEGVETTTQRDVLVELGCRRAQGHLFARAMAPDETEAWLSAHSLT
jgi:EAL domain-containing protein (putative c-di-GMP-specific phosphodiesterase class I)